MASFCVIKGQRFIELVSSVWELHLLFHCASVESCNFMDTQATIFIVLQLPRYRNITVPNFIIQGGDISGTNGVGGESIYGGYFDDESFEVNSTIYSSLTRSTIARIVLLIMASSIPNLSRFL